MADDLRLSQLTFWLASAVIYAREGNCSSTGAWAMAEAVAEARFWAVQYDGVERERARVLISAVTSACRAALAREHVSRIALIARLERETDSARATVLDLQRQYAEQRAQLEQLAGKAAEFRVDLSARPRAKRGPRT